MLEKVGKARASRGFVNGAHLKTEIDRHGGSVWIGQQRKLKPISQPISDNGESGRCGTSGIGHDSEIAALLTFAPAFFQLVHEVCS